MDEFPGLLARDFGFKPQGKSAPMAPSRANKSSFGLGSNASEFSKSSSVKSTVVLDDHDRDGLLFNDVFGGPPKYSSTSAVDSRSGNTSSFDYDSIFKDQKNLTSGSSKANSMPVYDKPVYDDDIFEGLPGLRSSSIPAPAAASHAASFDEVFASISTSSPKHKSARESSPLDDLLGNLGKKETESEVKSEKNVSAFDDLLPGFGRNTAPSSNRSTSDSSRSQKPPSNSTKTASSVLEDPFVVLDSTSTPMVSSSEVFNDPLEEIGKFGGSGSAKVNGSSVSGGVFDDLDPLNGFGKSVPPVSPEINERENDRSPLRSKSMSGTQTHTRKESIDRSSVENFEGYAHNRTPVDNFQGSNETLFDMPSGATDSFRSDGRATSPPSYMSAADSFRSAGRATSPPSYMSAADSLRSAGRATSPPSYTSATDSLRSAGRATSPPSYTSATDSLRSTVRATSPPSYTSATDSLRSTGRATSPPSYTSANPSKTNSQVNTTPKSEEMFESADDVWLTVSEIPLFTQPTSAPPPSRPPPPRPTRASKLDTANARKKANDYASFSNSPQYTHSPKSSRAGERSSSASQIDELEDFAMGRSRNNVHEYGDVPSGEDVESSIAAAAMKDAMDRAEAKFRHAKEMRERESIKAARSRESFQLDKEERAMQQDAQEKLDREMQQREKEEEEQRRLERERERARESEREREEKEREQRRLEKERERAREIEKEREKARQAVERATREARERAAAEARLKAERAAVDKANAAARERAERAAVQRAQAEARERAAAEARERAERAAAEARERANAEAREKEARERASVARAEAEARRRAERAAVERAAAEARERAAAEARERAAAAARANQNQQKNDNDLESFFSSRPSSAPRPRDNTSDSLFDNQSKGGPESARRTSVGASSNMKKASSTTNIVDDLSSIFGAATGSSAGEFQEVEGETEERRRARLERHQRTQERAAKALAEKNQRDLQAQRDQAERHRIAETLDVEIKRWAAGKEGNIRALLATLQYVLWPECGWQPVSLTDLITAAAVKKVYRKATLCIHPDKVQQKGANLQQKYIAEKVFDLLKEAWNKFNSEELF